MIFITILVFSYHSLHAAELCDEPGYPDQIPFDGCTNVAGLVWDTNNPTEAIDPNSSGTITVIGGRGPYTWTVKGSGYYLDGAYTEKSVTTKSPSVTYYTKEACGSGEIFVNDACNSTVQGAIRSTNGKWVQIGWPQSLYSCPIRGGPKDLVSYGKFIKIEGKYRLEQISSMSYYGHRCAPNSTSQCFDPGTVWAFNPLNPSHYSCVDDFAFEVSHSLPAIEGWVYEHDHCFWEKYTMSGWTCVKSWWADHHKYLYEWRCL